MIVPDKGASDYVRLFWLLKWDHISGFSLETPSEPLAASLFASSSSLSQGLSFPPPSLASSLRFTLPNKDTAWVCIIIIFVFPSFRSFQRCSYLSSSTESRDPCRLHLLRHPQSASSTYILSLLEFNSQLFLLILPRNTSTHTSTAPPNTADSIATRSAYPHTHKTRPYAHTAPLLN